MKLVTAYRLIDKECDFLGRDFPTVLVMIGENPWIFSPRVREAYDRVMADRIPA